MPNGRKYQYEEGEQPKEAVALDAPKPKKAAKPKKPAKEQ